MTQAHDGFEPQQQSAAGQDAPSAAANGEAASVGSFDRRMLEALVCPLTQTQLGYDSEAQELLSRAAKLAFPIRNGIPVMLVSEARELE